MCSGGFDTCQFVCDSDGLCACANTYCGVDNAHSFRRLSCHGFYCRFYFAAYKCRNRYVDILSVREAVWGGKPSQCRVPYGAAGADIAGERGNQKSGFIVNVSKWYWSRSERTCGWFGFSNAYRASCHVLSAPVRCGWRVYRCGGAA